jgi:hypothetical protein
VAVEKGTKKVISVNFSVYGKRTFNNLRANFGAETPRKGVFQQPQAITLKTPESRVNRKQKVEQTQERQSDPSDRCKP